MPIAPAITLRRSGLWLRSVLDELMPPGDVPEGADEWQPDKPDAYCPRCGASADEGGVTPRGCAFCLNKPVAWHRLTRLAFYGEPVDEWIRQLKFHRQWRYAPWMGSQLAKALEPARRHETCIVCAVPMHRLRRWRRGYNQADLIARAAAEALGLPLAPVLKRTRHTPPQTAIAPSRRHDNVRTSFAIEPVDLTGRDVLLIDDVKTSGATLTACTRLIKKAGARSVHAAVIAVADPKGQGFTAT